MHSPLQILVVDDEPDLELLVRQRFRKQIREGEFAFAFGQNGEEALRILADRPEVDVVLSDINMPVMDGLTLLSKISELNRTLKAVVVSAYGDMPNIRTAMNRGAIDFLMKPIDFEDLELTIRKSVDHVRELKRHFQTQQRLSAIEQELEVAARIQQSIIPCVFPPFPNRTEFELHAQMVPAKEVGGDLFDFFLLDHDRLGFVVGDVSGKGVPAALFMAVTRTLLRATAFQNLGAGECINYVNKALAAQNISNMFVTVLYGILDLRNGELKFVNGGHNPPYIVSKTGNVRELKAESGGMIVGILDAAHYKTSTTQLAKGETIVLFTDGVTEAVSTNGDFHGEDRLIELLGTTYDEPVMKIVKTVHESVQEFAAHMPQADDITVLALRYLGLKEG